MVCSVSAPVPGCGDAGVTRLWGCRSDKVAPVPGAARSLVVRQMDASEKQRPRMPSGLTRTQLTLHSF